MEGSTECSQNIELPIKAAEMSLTTDGLHYKLKDLNYV